MVTMYLTLPRGIFDAKLATTSTGRNWRTATALVALMDR